MEWTSGIDQKIIDGFLNDENLAVRELEKAGFPEEEVRERARELGLTKEFVKRCRLSGMRAGMRRCVNCDRLFLSAGPHNRLCPRCPKK
jgi:hypothetical protein